MKQVLVWLRDPAVGSCGQRHLTSRHLTSAHLIVSVNKCSCVPRLSQKPSNRSCHRCEAPAKTQTLGVFTRLWKLTTVKATSVYREHRGSKGCNEETQVKVGHARNRNKVSGRLLLFAPIKWRVMTHSDKKTRSAPSMAALRDAGGRIVLRRIQCINTHLLTAALFSHCLTMYLWNTTLVPFIPFCSLFCIWVIAWHKAQGTRHGASCCFHLQLDTRN